MDGADESNAAASRKKDNLKDFMTLKNLKISHLSIFNKITCFFLNTILQTKQKNSRQNNR